MLPEEKAKSTNLLTLWDFEGVLKYSPIFYGYYTNKNGTRNGYRLPFAYFMTGLAVYIYSFVATLKRYGLYWPVQCMPVWCTLAGMLYTGRYGVHWPVRCIMAGTVYTGWHSVHWPVQCLMASRVYTDQCNVCQPMQCTLTSTMYTGQYIVYWPVLLYTGWYSVYWLVHFTLASTVYTGQ
jgi:hypothetical protein